MWQKRRWRRKVFQNLIASPGAQCIFIRLIRSRDIGGAHPREIVLGRSVIAKMASRTLITRWVDAVRTEEGQDEGERKPEGPERRRDENVLLPPRTALYKPIGLEPVQIRLLSSAISSCFFGISPPAFSYGLLSASRAHDSSDNFLAWIYGRAPYQLLIV